jgi:hypothetical protein
VAELANNNNGRHGDRSSVRFQRQCANHSSSRGSNALRVDAEGGDDLRRADDLSEAAPAATMSAAWVCMIDPEEHQTSRVAGESWASSSSPAGSI